ncbi:MAG: zinc-ribbon and DUF3426 domain-containing protein [Woeseiaceae bacterium]|nr:zinc-ribbon and DUF3426 domain-containing protein [Woeseiaceae bacterium]
MFTECPKCRTVFRLNATVLRKAHGKVRCGGCANTFNALDHLLEELPDEDAGNTQTARAFEEQSQALLRSLDEFAGPDAVRIEDTGVEWRVYDDEDEDGAAPDDGDDADTSPPGEPVAHPQKPLDLDVGTPDPGEMRFDDNTPLPDEFFRPAEQAAPQRRAEDHEPPPPSDEFQVDLEFGEAEDWRDLLAEVEAGREEAGEEHADDSGSVPTLQSAAASDAELREWSITAERDATGAQSATPSAGKPASREPSLDDEIDRELLEAAGESQSFESPAEAFGAESAAFAETIVMEGDTISGLDIEELTQTGADIPAAAAAEDDTEETPRRRYGALAAAILLGLLLAAQLVHANRATLATWNGFDATLAPLYSALGQPVTPAWDVRGWEFQATSGATDASGERLTIQSRIANRATAPLPYPLVHVSLTDRWEDVIGSRILRPGEYLPAGTAGRGVVQPGRDFTAVIRIAAPAPDATGFKLNVCYRAGPERLRCAVDDFRD